MQTLEWLDRHSVPYHEVCLTDDTSAHPADVFVSPTDAIADSETSLTLNGPALPSAITSVCWKDIELALASVHQQSE
jgi:hypothetical protein